MCKRGVRAREKMRNRWKPSEVALCTQITSVRVSEAFPLPGYHHAEHLLHVTHAEADTRNGQGKIPYMPMLVVLKMPIRPEDYVNSLLTSVLRTRKAMVGSSKGRAIRMRRPRQLPPMGVDSGTIPRLRNPDIQMVAMSLSPAQPRL